MYNIKMYSVLFHVSGIALLEICFYFLYIGPMETIIFTDKVERLANEPLNNPYVLPSFRYNSTEVSNENEYIDFDIIYPKSNGMIKFSFNNFLQNIPGFNDTLIYNDIKNDKDRAIERRNAKNHTLLIATIEYWILVTFLNILIYFVIKQYKSINKLKKTNGVTTVSSTSMDEESLEMVEVNSYRRYSIDDEHLETSTEVTSPQRKQIAKVCKNVLHYVFFGICLMSFQYMFFKNVIMVYDPLSIEEVKYIVYNLILPKLREEQTQLQNDLLKNAYN